MTARTQAQRSAGTIAELTAHARELFGTKGYAATAIEDIVRKAGVTRGALYHHFDGKLAVFQAVFVDVQRELARRTAEVAAQTSGGPLRQLEAGCIAFVDVCADPGVQQIFLVDGFTVLGWHQLREFESDYTLAQMRVAVEAAVAAGELDRRPAEPIVAMLYGGLCEAAMLIARSPDPATMRSAVCDEIHRTFQGLRRHA